MSRAKGDIAETLAVKFLLDEGYRILEQNFYSRFGEIDIIALKEEVVHFIEVKSASSYEQAIRNITPSKIGKLTKTLHVYLKKSKLELDYQLDAIIVVDSTCEMLESITL